MTDYAVVYEHEYGTDITIVSSESDGYSVIAEYMMEYLDDFLDNDGDVKALLAALKSREYSAIFTIWHDALNESFSIDAVHDRTLCNIRTVEEIVNSKVNYVR